MNKKETENRSYAASMIDQEGCISIRKVQPKKENYTTSYQLQISVNQIDGEAVDYMYGVFGGFLYYIQRHDPIRSDNWRWEITGVKAMEFLKKIMPFLKIKKTQAELGIRFQINHKKAVNQNKPQQPRDLEFYEWCYKEMRRLKTIHNSPKAFVKNAPRAAATTNQVDLHIINEGCDSLVLQEKVTVS